MPELTLEDIPVEVLKSVYEKWDRTETPEDIDWNTCTMCTYIKREYNLDIIRDSECEKFCPLYYPTGYCRSRPYKSILHIEYWKEQDPEASKEELQNLWIAHKFEFLEMLRELIQIKEKIKPYDKGIIYVKCPKCGSTFNEEALGHLTIKVDKKDRDILTFYCSNCNNYVESFRYSKENI